jgi:hypothetical protein
MGFRRPLGILVGMLVLGVTMLAAAPAALANGHHEVVTSTMHEHETVSVSGTNPCTGVAITGTREINAVFHITYFVNEDEVWATFTETSKIALTDENGVTYSGHSTFWGNFNVNERNGNTTFTASIHIRGSDGSSLDAHDVSHVTYNGNGEITVSFDKPRFVCG